MTTVGKKLDTEKAKVGDYLASSPGHALRFQSLFMWAGNEPRVSSCLFRPFCFLEKGWMGKYFERMKSLSTNKELPSRIRFMLMDIIDLRKNKVQYTSVM